MRWAAGRDCLMNMIGDVVGLPAVWRATLSNILTGTLCPLMARAVMGLEQVKTEIVLVITPHRVDMISLILGAIHLNQEAGRLDAVIVQATAFNCSGPSEEGGVLRLL